MEKELKHYIQAMDVWINFTKEDKMLKPKWYPYMVNALEAQSMKLGKENIYIQGMKKFKLRGVNQNQYWLYYVLICICRNKNTGVTLPGRIQSTVFTKYSEARQAMKNVHKGRRDLRFRTFVFGLEECQET